MLVIVLIPATAMIIIWLFLLFKITQDDWMMAAYNRVLDNLEAVEKMRLKDAEKQEKLNSYHGITKAVVKIFSSSSSEKQIAKLLNKNTRLQEGYLKHLGLLDIPGYVLLRSSKIFDSGEIRKKVYFGCVELYGIKYAEKRAQQLLARIMSYFIIGVAMTLLLGALLIGGGYAEIGIMILVFGTAIVVTLVYSLYDSIRSRLSKRRDAIGRQLPNVVSKLALLVSSGMIMDRAWHETAYSQDTELYKEMQKTAEERGNLVSPEAAYGAFIGRCNNKETTKLASAIMQNLSKGNTEIGGLLKDMAKEAWQERRHTAKRDAEKANSKLLIPTMLLFAAILIMIMVPVALNFGGL